MLKNLVALFQNLTNRNVFNLFLIALLTIIASVFEVLTLGALVPFITFLVDPSKLQDFAFFKFIIKDPTSIEHNSLLLYVTAIFLVSIVTSVVVRTYLFRLSTNTAFGIGHLLSKKAFSNLLYLEYIQHIEHHTSEIINTITMKTNAVIMGVLMPLILAFSSLFIASSIILVLLAFDTYTTIIVTLWFGGFYFCIMFFTKRKLKKDSKKIAHFSSKVIETLQNGIGFIREIILGQSQNIHISIFSQADLTVRKAQSDYMFIGQAPRYIVEGLGMIIIVVTAYFNVSDDSVENASILPFLALLALAAQRMLPLLQTIYASITTLRVNEQILDDVIKLINMEPERRDESLFQNENIIKFEKSLNFDCVSFAYPGSKKYIVNNLSFEIKKGEKIGIKGRSGIGKSTIADLIMGLLEPSNGTITIDGTPLTKHNKQNWQSGIAHVPQDIFLTDSTIEQNIVLDLSGKEVNQERLSKAVHFCGLKDVIEEVSRKKIKTIGENGQSLSGGQKQRIGIARAIYNDSKVLILDEASSALDRTTKEFFLENLYQLDCTIIFISHDSGTIAKCDRIFEFNNSGLKIYVN